MNTLGGLRALALVLLVVLSLFIVFSPLAPPLRHTVFDGYQRLFRMERVTAPVKVVLIDENAIGRVGQWPWPRTRMADLVARIAEHKPLAIGLDLFFPEPDRFSPAAMASELPILPQHLREALDQLPSNDERFAAAIRGRDVVLGISAEGARDGRFPRAPRAQPVVLPQDLLKSLRSYPGHIASVGVVDAAAAGRGIMNSGPQDQVVRQVPIVAQVQGAIVPALGIETFRVAVGEGVRLNPGRLGVAEVQVGQWRMPMQNDGNTWLRFAPHTYEFSISAADVIEGNVKPDFLRDQIILVGISGLGVLDHKTTPLGEFIPGVYVHAQLIENLYNGVTLVRPEWAPYAEAAALIVAGLLLILYLPRLSALQGINVVFGLLVLIVGAGLIAFRNFSILLDPAWPAIGTLAVFGSVVVGSLSEAEKQRRLLREQAAHMAGEVDAARRIQMGLLPDPQEALGHDRRFSIAAFLEPARTVGGDFYDCFMVDARHLFFLVADVSGKGLAAALFMAAAKSHIKSAALREAQVGEALTSAQDEIMRENPEQLFVTAFAGRLDVQTGMLEYANAGHEPPFRRRPDAGPERLGESGGPPLCVVDDYDHPTYRLQVEPGECLVLVTDGVTEAMNPSREFFGLDRLRAALSWFSREVTPEEVIRRLRQDVQKFAAGAEPADDLTLLVVRWEGPRGP